LKNLVLTFLVILMSVAMITPMIGCQSSSVSPAPAVTPQSNAPSPAPAVTPQPNAPTPAPLPVSPSQPPAPTPPPAAVQPSQPSLQITVELENGLRVIPVGLSIDINYSVNRSANVIIFSTLPDGSVVSYIKDICIPGTSYSYHIAADRPVGERVITAKAVGIDGQTSTATYKYWVGSVQGDLDKP
jgi:hypothetical protein